MQLFNKHLPQNLHLLHYKLVYLRWCSKSLHVTLAPYDGCSSSVSCSNIILPSPRPRYCHQEPSPFNSHCLVADTHSTPKPQYCECPHCYCPPPLHDPVVDIIPSIQAARTRCYKSPHLVLPACKATPPLLTVSLSTTWSTAQRSHLLSQPLQASHHKLKSTSRTPTLPYLPSFLPAKQSRSCCMEQQSQAGRMLLVRRSCG